MLQVLSSERFNKPFYFYLLMIQLKVLSPHGISPGEID
jgi:hypothetical protein